MLETIYSRSSTAISSAYALLNYTANLALLCLLLSSSMLLSVYSFANDNASFLVDDADSTNFEDFHKQAPNKNKRALRDIILGEDDRSISQHQLSNIPAEKRLIASSTLNTQNASQTINGLYAAMLKNCPEGFIKLREWSQKDISQGHIILQFEYSCQL